MDAEYAIRKDVRNNAVVREIDQQQRRQFFHSVGVAALVVIMLVFSTWQHLRVIDSGYDVSAQKAAEAAAVDLNRRLRLQLEQRRAPSLIEERATRELHMIDPPPADVIDIERPPMPISRPAATKVVVAGIR